MVLTRGSFVALQERPTTAALLAATVVPLVWMIVSADGAADGTEPRAVCNDCRLAEGSLPARTEPNCPWAILKAISWGMFWASPLRTLLRVTMTIPISRIVLRP